MHVGSVSESKRVVDLELSKALDRILAGEKAITVRADIGYDTSNRAFQ